MHNKKYLILLALQFRGVGRKTVAEIFFSKAKAPSTIDELKAVLLQKKIAINNIEKLKQAVEKDMWEMDSEGVKYILEDESLYPKQFWSIPDRPNFIFVKGDIASVLKKQCVAIIGTRNPTNNGKQAAARLAKLYAEKEFCVVSGLALGCDTAAHEGALATGIEHSTMAILGNGICSKIYPKINEDLAKRILQNGGCLISEYYNKESSQPANFVHRDRLQSGMSKGVIVVETDIKGGTMHTVRFSKEQGRLLGAYPNRYPQVVQAKGTEKLLQEGAFRLNGPREIEEFAYLMKKNVVDKIWEQPAKVDKDQMSLGEH